MSPCRFLMYNVTISIIHVQHYRSVVNPRTGSRAALKKIPSVFQSLLSCIRTFREIKILCELNHDNVCSLFDTFVLYHVIAYTLIHTYTHTHTITCTHTFTHTHNDIMYII